MSKRRRTDGEGPAGPEIEADEPTPVLHCQEVWFEDGNLVIQAGNTQFKVHRGVLAKHSPVFADLFKVPHPEDEPTVDGCPVVELHDSAYDLKHVLLALYGDPQVIMANKRLHFLVLAAMLRLGKKYEIEHLREQSLAVLKQEFPTQLEDYENVMGGWAFVQFPCDDTYDNASKMLAAVIEVAHECNVQSILPLAYFQYVTCQDGLVDILEPAESPPFQYRALVNCLIARDSLLEVKFNCISEWSREVGHRADCQSRDVCRCLFGPVVTFLLTDSPLRMCDSLYPWSSIVDDLPGEFHRLCGTCRSVVQASYEASRRRVWTALPTYFGLPKWEDLKDLEA